MAMGTILMDYFLDLQNSLEDCSTTTSSSSPDEGQKQENKRARKKLVSKAEIQTTINDKYYSRCDEFFCFYSKTDWYEPILELWDKFCWESQDDIMASEMQCSQSSSEESQELSEFRKYLQKAKIRCAVTEQGCEEE